MNTAKVLIVEGEIEREVAELRAKLRRERLTPLLEEAAAPAPASNPEEEEEGLWKVERVARYLNISESQVYEIAKTGELPSRRLGERQIRFDPDEVKAYARGKRGAVAEVVAFSANRRRHGGRHG